MLGQACRLEFGELSDHGRGAREASYDLHGFIPLLCPHDGQMYFQGLEHWVKTLDKDVHQLVFVHRLFVEGQLSLAKREVRNESLQVGVAIFLHGGAVEFQAEWANFIHGVDHESGSDILEERFDLSSFNVSDFHENVVMEGFGDSHPALSDPFVGVDDSQGFFGAFGFFRAKFVEGSGTHGIGHIEDVFAGLAPALVSDANAPSLVLVGGAKFVERRACIVVGSSHCV